MKTDLKHARMIADRLFRKPPLVIERRTEARVEYDAEIEAMRMRSARLRKERQARETST